MTSRLRTLAFYLPQFHPIAENDEWWGKGFTEWTNVTRAVPQYEGHVQPVLPTDLGFTDLRLPETRRAQAELAKAHGVDGFVYYHYWFNGRRLLERPFDEVLSSGDPDFPFAICWANEDWRANWDGRSGEVLLGQHYSEDDDRAHIHWMIEAFRDDRYIRVDGKPLVLVYRVALLPDPARTARVWREEAKAAGIGDLHLCYVESMERLAVKPEVIGFDAAIEFAPEWQINPGEQRGTVEVHDYLDMAARMHAKADPGYRRYPCVTPGFDNTPRKGKDGYVTEGATPDLYKGWLTATAQKELETAARYDGDALVFVNAWNEWAEGATLEPSSKWGRGFLEAHAAAVGAIDEALAAPIAPAAPAATAPTPAVTSILPAATLAALNGNAPAPAPAPVAAPSVPAPAATEGEATPLGREGQGVTVAMVTSGDPGAMMRALQSAVETCTEVGRLQFVVVDNGSTDDTAATLAQLRDEITSVRNDEPRPTEVAWEQAVELATGEFVVLLTTDVVLRPGWHVKPILNLAADPLTAAVMPHLALGQNLLPSQPLSMSTGVCMVARTTMVRDSLPTEARLVPESVVALAPAPVIAPPTI